jgi:hypothetical protein
MRWRRRPAAEPEVVEAVRRFDHVHTCVDRARDHLLLGIPVQRRARLPLAEALAGFEEKLAEAASAMDGWHVEATEAEWIECAEALRTARAGAERLRLGQSGDAYEELVPVIEAILEPLEAFDRAAPRIQALTR